MDPLPVSYVSLRDAMSMFNSSLLGMRARQRAFH